MFDKNKIYAELASQGRARQEMPQIASGYNPKGGGGKSISLSRCLSVSVSLSLSLSALSLSLSLSL